MVCNLLAVITAKLDAKDAAELLASEVGLAAYAQALEPLIGAVTLQRTDGMVALRGARASVYVRPSGITMYAGISITRAEGEIIAAQAVQIAQALALPLAQQRLVDTIKAKYGKLAVTADAYQGAARVTRVRIPV